MSSDTEKMRDRLYQRYLSSAFGIEGVMFLYYNDKASCSPRNPDTNLKQWSERAMESGENSRIVADYFNEYRGDILLGVLSKVIELNRIMELNLAKGEERKDVNIETVFEGSITDIIREIIGREELTRNKHADEIKVALIDRILHHAVDLTVKYRKGELINLRKI